IIGTREAGIYGAASKIAGIVTIGLLFANSVLAPYISELFHNNKVHYLQYLVTYSTRIASIIAVLILLSFYFYGEIILKLFGEEFTVGHNAMVILSIGMILNVIAGSVGLLMSMTGHQKQAVSFFITGCIINIVLNLLFIPRYGIEGAAIATAISIAFWNISLAIYIKYKLSINSTIFNTLKYVNKNS
ncbi:MAG: polysaccharide biosynthesis C-terminal domain-containing protein, partial [Gammaproteobacteria bacterium]